MNRAPFATGEWYHCYNRGVEKRNIFEDAGDYKRFLTLLYTGNGTLSVRISNLTRSERVGIFLEKHFERGEQTVEVGAYSLMPNHFHLLLRQVTDGGISSFMRKVFTGYTMYFNTKYDRNGVLFQGPCQAKHVSEDRYLQHLVSYIHLNPIELFEPRWKEGVGNIRAIEKHLRGYEYSSWPDFHGKERPQRKIVGPSIFEVVEIVPPKKMLSEAQEYYQMASGARDKG